MRNKDIRDYARIKDVRLWQIADKLNLCDSNFSRMLRHELTEETKDKIKTIIDELAEGRWWYGRKRNQNLSRTSF